MTEKHRRTVIIFIISIVITLFVGIPWAVLLDLDPRKVKYLGMALFVVLLQSNFLKSKK